VERGAESGAVGGGSDGERFPPDLQAVVAAWPTHRLLTMI